MEYKFLKYLLDKLNFAGPVRCTDLGNFYSSIHKYQNSAEILMKYMRLFSNESFSNEHIHVCFTTSVEIGKYLMDLFSKRCVSQPRQLTSRTITNASRSRIRYVGRFCIAKLRFAYMKKMNTVRYSKTPEDQQIYEESVTELMNQLQVGEQFILANSCDPESLLDVSRKQNVNRELTNISDELFQFSTELSQFSFSHMISKNFNKHGSDFL